MKCTITQQQQPSSLPYLLGRIARWRRPLSVRSELHIAASAAVVWEWLVQAERWPEWYANAPAVAYTNQTRAELGAGSVFSWRSVGMTLTATVGEYVPGQRLGWVVRGPGIRACHHWLLRETATGCQVVTEQKQVGWRSAVRELVWPQQVYHHQQLWLLALSQQVRHGHSPYLHPAGSHHVLAEW